jgi:Protein of unknown function (DUF2442)
MRPGYIPEVVGVSVLPPYGLEVHFDDQTVRRINLERALTTRLRGPVFDPLQDPAFFAQAYVDTETGTVAWPNGADLAPEALYEDYDPIAETEPTTTQHPRRP